MGVAVIILAAGGSSRLGRAKQLLPVHGKSLLRRSVEAAVQSRAARCFVVLGSEASACATEVADLPAEVVVHSLWRNGMASSIRAGVQAARRSYPELEAVVIALCDQPYLDASVINGLIEAWRASSCSIVASEYAGHRGAPALFSAVQLDRLEALSGEGGARSLFQAESSDVASVPFPLGGVDVDTEADYASVTQAAVPG